ncbi:oxidoreductase [Spirochaetia bacterium]|nr:oxidoreductase [Spirochaetia bacterium]
MEQIPVAIIGLGRIASLLEDDKRREKPCTHAGAIAANSDCRLAAGVDIDEERRRLFSERWNVPVYADAAAMLAEHSPAMLVIATHPDSHAQYCRLAAAVDTSGAAHSIPVVICEKPLADTLRKARQIAALTASKGGAPGVLKIVTNHERRYSEDYISARAVLAEGRLGKLLGVRGCLYMGRGRRLLDVLWHDGTHLADAIMFLTGSTLKHRRSWGARLTAHPAAAGKAGTAYLEGALEIPRDVGQVYENEAARREPQERLPLEKKLTGRRKGKAAQVPVLIEVGAGRDHLVFEMEFSCEQGRLRIGNGVYEVWESGESPYAQGFRSLKRTGDVFEGPTGYFANMVRDAVACVREPDRQPLSGAADGLRVIEYLNSVRPWR